MTIASAEYIQERQSEANGAVIPEQQDKYLSDEEFRHIVNEMMWTQIHTYSLF